jgi:hypothetical protein
VRGIGLTDLLQIGTSGCVREGATLAKSDESIWSSFFGDLPDFYLFFSFFRKEDLFRLVEPLADNCQHRPVQYLNNVLEQDHRAIKRRIRASQNFRSFWGAWRTIAGYEAVHMIREGQACWSAAGAKVGLLHRFIVNMFGMEV